MVNWSQFVSWLQVTYSPISIIHGKRVTMETVKSQVVTSFTKNLYCNRELGNYGSLGVTHSLLLTWVLCGNSGNSSNQIYCLKYGFIPAPLALPGGLGTQWIHGWISHTNNIILTFYGSRSVSFAPPSPSQFRCQFNVKALHNRRSKNIYIDNFRTNKIYSS
jgi:hypothetical protein